MELAKTNGGASAQVARPAGAVQKITISGTSAKTTEFTGNFTTVRVCSSTDCFYRIGATGDDATTSHNYLPAGAVEYIYVNSGDFVHFIQSTAGGFATVGICS